MATAATVTSTTHIGEEIHMSVYADDLNGKLGDLIPSSERKDVLITDKFTALEFVETLSETIRRPDVVNLKTKQSEITLSRVSVPKVTVKACFKLTLTESVVQRIECLDGLADLYIDTLTKSNAEIVGFKSVNVL
jgi:hypothetical protein